MKKTFFYTLTVCIPVLLCVFTGCGATKGEEMLPYNAILGLGGPSVLREDFMEANRTYGAHWDEEKDSTSPEFRTFIVTEKAKLDEIFSVCSEVDFEKGMVVMYAYTSVYGNRYHIIKSVTLNNKSLRIEFKYVEGKPGLKDASSPQTRFLVIKMDKLDIDTVEFTLLNPRG